MPRSWASCAPAEPAAGAPGVPPAIRSARDLRVAGRAESGPGLAGVVGRGAVGQDLHAGRVGLRVQQVGQVAAAGAQADGDELIDRGRGGGDRDGDGHPGRLGLGEVRRPVRIGGAGQGRDGQRIGLDGIAPGDVLGRASGWRDVDGLAGGVGHDREPVGQQLGAR